VHGSGFLAAFAAGLTIALFDVELCDCFKEYGETTAELLLLLTFVLLGSSLIWSGLPLANGRTLAFAVLVLLARPAIYLTSFARSRVDRSARRIVAWFGPRGLSSLLLALLPVFAGAPAGAEIFRIACLVVLLSIVVHGGTWMWLARTRRGDPTPPGEASAELVSPDEVRALLAAGEKLVPIDVRKPDPRAESDLQAAGSRRLSLDGAAEDARVQGLPSDAWLVTYCT
jgi:NhaP-type Na+/H+ or K+/H+ antiporter